MSVNDCNVRLRTFPNSSCANIESTTQLNVIVTEAGGLNSATWTLIGGTTTETVTDSHAKLDAECSIASGSAPYARIDNFFAGVGLTVPVELESFEID